MQAVKNSYAAEELKHADVTFPHIDPVTDIYLRHQPYDYHYLESINPTATDVPFPRVSENWEVKDQWTL